MIDIKIRLSQIRTEHMEELCKRIDSIAATEGTFLENEHEAAKFIGEHSNELEEFCNINYGAIYGKGACSKNKTVELVFDTIELIGLYTAIMY